MQEISAYWTTLVSAIPITSPGGSCKLAGEAAQGGNVRGRTETPGGQALVVQGDEVGSMAGSIARTWKYRHLLTNLVVKDLKLKYQRSLLGFTWSLLNPLIMIGVYTVAFTLVMQLPTPRFVLFILTGLLSWNFFSGAVLSATDAVSAQGSLLRSVVFPRVVLPFSAVLFNLVQYLLTIAVFMPVVLLVYGVEPQARMLLFPVFLVLQVLFTAGLALALATAAAAFHDVRHLVEVGVGIGFWATPIIYEPTMVPEQFRRVALLSPMASFVHAYQDLFYYGATPELAVWIVATVYAFGAFVCGLSVFLAYEARMPRPRGVPRHPLRHRSHETRLPAIRSVAGTSLQRRSKKGPSVARGEPFMATIGPSMSTRPATLAFEPRSHTARQRPGVGDHLPVELGRHDLSAGGHALHVDVARGRSVDACAAKPHAGHYVVAGDEVVLEELQVVRHLRADAGIADVEERCCGQRNGERSDHLYPSKGPKTDARSRRRMARGSLGHWKPRCRV